MFFLLKVIIDVLIYAYFNMHTEKNKSRTKLLTRRDLTPLVSVAIVAAGSSWPSRSVFLLASSWLCLAIKSEAILWVASASVAPSLTSFSNSALGILSFTTAPPSSSSSVFVVHPPEGLSMERSEEDLRVSMRCSSLSLAFM